MYSTLTCGVYIAITNGFLDLNVKVFSDSKGTKMLGASISSASRVINFFLAFAQLLNYLIGTLPQNESNSSTEQIRI